MKENIFFKTFKIFYCAFFLIMGMCFFKSVETYAFSGGDGSRNSPYLISHQADLSEFAFQVNRGKSYGGKYIKLTQDIKLSFDVSSFEGECGWNPIGGIRTPFAGNFDGDNHKITGLFISRPNENDVGFFGVTSFGSSIVNLRIKASDISGKERVGVLVADNLSFIKNCNIQAKNISGYNMVGGLVGINGGCISESRVKSESIQGRNKIGGFAGESAGNITFCECKSEVEGKVSVGGFLGNNKGLATACRSYGKVTGGNYVGGFAGRNTRCIVECTARADTFGSSTVGGFAGKNQGTVHECETKCKVKGESWRTGGFVGSNDNGAVVEKCKSDCRVKGRSGVGGFAGYNSGILTSGEALGTVEGRTCVGEVVGLDAKTTLVDSD